MSENVVEFSFWILWKQTFKKKNLTESSEFKDLSIFPLFSKPLPKPVFRFDSEQRRFRPPVGQVLLVDSVPSSSASKGGEIWGFQPPVGAVLPCNKSDFNYRSLNWWVDRRISGYHQRCMFTDKISIISETLDTVKLCQIQHPIACIFDSVDWQNQLVHRPLSVNINVSPS